MKEFSKKMDKFETGVFQMLDEKLQERLKENKKVYNFSIGTPDFPPHTSIMEAVSKAALDPNNYKYSLKEIDELIIGVQNRFSNRYGVSLEESEIMSIYGSQEGIAHIGLSICDPGDVVLIPNPGYPIFEIGPLLVGAEIQTYDLYKEDGYLPRLHEIDEEILKKTKFIIVSYPLNPVGMCANDQFYKELITWAKKHEIIILHDNAYSDIVFDNQIGKSILSYDNAKDVCVEFYSLSKSYNYTGARMAFLVGNETIISNFKKLRSQIDYGTFLPVQYGAVAALTIADKEIEKQCMEYEKRRNALCDGFGKIGWNIPYSKGTMFVWAPIPENETDDMEFTMKLFDATGVLVTPGSSFGTLGKNHVRFALTMEVAEIENAINQVNACGVLQ